MPKLTIIDECYTCFLCGRQAFYISVNTKKMRCVEKITQCPGFVQKAEKSRQKNTTEEERKAHMKALSAKGNAALKQLHADEEWLAAKSNKISSAVKKRGGHSGTNNPMYGKHHSEKTLAVLCEKANQRDPKCYNKATETKIDRGIAISKDLKSEWELYREQVIRHTYKSWRDHSDVINPQGLPRGEEYELDHKFSITEGFKQRIDPSIIGDYRNLELLPKLDNRSKYIACSITLEELLRSIQTDVIIGSVVNSK